MHSLLRTITIKTRHCFFPSRGLLRFHFNHGGAPQVVASDEAGPRWPLHLGLASTRASSHVLRLLESSHGSVHCAVDTMQDVWHSKGLRFILDHGEWHGVTGSSKESTAKSTGSGTAMPSLSFLIFSDDRTALAKLLGVDGRERFVSLLRLDDSGNPRPINDGWLIVREVVGNAQKETRYSTQDACYSAVSEVVLRYLDVEHGGGKEDADVADVLFAEKASLLSVGSNSLEHGPSSSNSWTAPVGSFLDVPRDVYLHGVLTQTPHSMESRQYDSISGIHMLKCGTAAAATVQVGNGARDRLFVDHLLLGKSPSSNNKWAILSKIFSPQPWLPP
jgi:hypothetical protein